MPTFVVALRWIALLPAALIAGWLGYFLMAWAWNISLSMQGIDNNELWVRVCHVATSGLAMGGAYVYVGAYLAPSHKLHAAIGLAVVAGLYGGATIALTLYIASSDWEALWHHWEGLWQCVCLVVGAGVAAVAIATEGLRNPLT